MPVSESDRRAIACALVCLCALALIAVSIDPALAQNPFAAPKAAPAPATGILGFIFEKQAQFYRQLSETMRAAKNDGSAVWALLGISFAYGVFHAAGPGHGKAVIASYVVANEETWRRGVILSFASALLQALAAIALVGVLAAILNVTARSMGNAVRVIETVSYALIVLLGARLTWSKGRAFLTALRAKPVAHAHDHAHHDHAHAHDHDHVHDEHCGHAHGPEPSALAGPGGWKRGLTAIVAVGLRPCSGAIFVLVFALAQGMFLTGMASTLVMGLGTALTVALIATFAVAAKSAARRFAGSGQGAGMIALRGVEAGAAVLVLLLGLALLMGYLVSERMIGFSF